ncbi:hypothetical protein AB4865_07010 [Capnocytophaga sp. ARDL2]|uniref:hypothetical protein n=1 Tax=Capnocytophaga sp. ARDL2 TaxID=3238809 RepID=UPI0035580BE9
MSILIKSFIASELKREIKNRLEEEKQVIVHFSLWSDAEGDMARIWKSTFLIDCATGIKYPLLIAYGISYAPDWTVIPPTRPLDFTLIFQGLPKSCILFDLVEEIPEDGGFEVRNIHRNQEDIYFVS